MVIRGGVRMLKSRLRHLVNGGAVDVAHLVELVDAHDAAVGEHHGAWRQFSNHQ